jgi:hypothetical protein
MKKILTVTAAVAALTLATVAAPDQAQARHGRNGALIGGLAAGALIGAAVASGPYYGYGPGPYAYYGGDCYWTRERVWTPYGWRFHRVRVCD